MTDIEEIIAAVLRLDARATPGPWDEDGIYMGLRHLGKHCSDWYYRDSDGNLIEVPQEKDAALIAYYRTAAPALAREVQRLQGDVERLCVLVDYLREEEEPYERDRLQAEVQRLQGEVRQAQTGHDCALVAAYESAHRAGQEAMRERCASRAARDADGACNCGRPICPPDCARVRLLDLADAIRALEVEP